RMGEKPLYYGPVGNGLGFASELKALRAMPKFAATIDREALAGYLAKNAVPSPLSIYRGIRKLPASHHLALHEGDLARGSLPTPTAYWSLAEIARSGLETPQRFDSDDTA